MTEPNLQSRSFDFQSQYFSIVIHTSISHFCKVQVVIIWLCSKAEVPNLQDVMPDMRNKEHDKHNALESSQNHPPPAYPHSVGKLSSMKLIPGAKKTGDHYSTLSVNWLLTAASAKAKYQFTTLIKRENFWKVNSWLSITDNSRTSSNNRKVILLTNTGNKSLGQ